METTATRDDVADVIMAALAQFDLDALTDGVMDSLDTVVEWGDDDDE